MLGRATGHLVIAGLMALTAAGQNETSPLWSLARSKASIHQFSTLFTSHAIRDKLGSEAGLADAVAWCRATGVTKVYLESFRDGYQADRAVLESAKKRFLSEGFAVSGCVTTTKVGKKSTGWNLISCYTDQDTQEKLQAIFAFEASLFDEIMIDDFWFTDCKCPVCDAARLAKRVTIGDHVYPVAGDTWEDYRCELMTRVSQHRVLEAAKRANPKVRIIIKYPEWYDQFHERGYEILRETAEFDRIWVGTETRDYANKSWGGKPPFAAYFIMRWLGGVGGAKCGGGWYDPLGTTPSTYIEQARQTVLAGAAESMLFAYDCLLRDTGPQDIEALRANIPDLLRAAEIVHGRQPVGVAAYKPANSPPENEARVFDFVGMLGLPLAPCHTFPADAKAAFFSMHALRDPAFPQELAAFIAVGKPVLITDGLAARLSGQVRLDSANVRILPVRGNPKSLLTLPASDVDALRQPLLRALGHEFQAPVSTGLYLFEGGAWAVENFGDQPVTVRLDGQALTLPARQWQVGAAK